MQILPSRRICTYEGVQCFFHALMAAISTISTISTILTILTIPSPGRFACRACYKWEMKGGYSIKNVLPALVPELSYAGLEIANGGAAMEAYHEMCVVSDQPEELAASRANLLAYCKLDTLAMVQVLEKLYQLTS